MEVLARRIRKDLHSKSTAVKVIGNEVVIFPLFQQNVTVTSWEQYQTALKEGRIAPPDEETCWGEGS